MTEAIFGIAEALGTKVSHKQLSDVSLESNMRINTGAPGWLDALIGDLAKAFSKKKKFIRELMQAKTYLTDSLIHVQLGNPDRIFFHKG